MEEVNKCDTPQEYVPKLWVLDYTKIGNQNYAGMAVVFAQDVHSAERIFLSSTVHNGEQDKIIVNSLQQVPYPYTDGLLAEKYVKTF